MQDAPARTFFGSVAALVIAGFAATALPLIVALVVGSIQVSHLTRQSERTILDSAHATRSSEFVADELVSMERNARQYVVLGDPALLRLYQERYAQLLATLQNLDTTSLGVDNRAQLESIRRLATDVTNVIAQSPPDSEAVASALGQFAKLHRDAANLRQASDASMDRELNALTSRSNDVQQAFIWQSILLGSSGVILATLFVIAILRPIRQINRSISRMGAERFDEPISVDGPRDLRQIGERLDWLRTRLQQVDQQKNEFVRHMSHELKTPLANIRESTGLLLDNTVGCLNETQHDIVRILDSSAQRLHLLVDNLINLARWREHHAVSIGSFELGGLIEAEVRGHRLLLERKSLRLSVSRPESLMVNADRERMRTLIANLLSNAIKYSPVGGTITLKVLAGSGEVVLDVTDEGPGIVKSDKERVFEPFFQSAGNASVEGTGIGLSLVRECISSHGGTAAFIDGARGAHFRAHLPILDSVAETA